MSAWYSGSRTPPWSPLAIFRGLRLSLSKSCTSLIPKTTVRHQRISRNGIAKYSLIHSGKDKEKTCNAASANAGKVLGIWREWIIPIPNNIGPKVQDGGRLAMATLKRL